MRITFTLLFLVGCGTDTFKGVDDGGDAATDVSTIEGGPEAGDAGDGGMVVKPRMFVSLVAQQSALLVWDDPESIATPRMPSATIPLAAAYDVVVAKKRVFVAGGPEIFSFDKALELSSQSKPTSLGKGAFVGVSQANPLNVVALHWEPTLDILTTGDDGPAALQVFKSASTASPLMASARIWTDSDNVLHPAMAPNGQAFASRNGGYTTLFFDGANSATLSVTSGNFVFGSGRPLTTNNRVYIPGVNGGTGGASVFIYTPFPVTNMQLPSPELHAAFGGAAMSDSAREVAVTSTFLAAAVWKVPSDSYICVMMNPSTLSAGSMCDHVIPVSGKILRLKERNGSLYASIPGRIEIYRKPLMDTQPSVTLNLGDPGNVATGIAFAE